MANVCRTAQAERDLIEIWKFIARDNPAAADKFLDRVDDKSELIAGMPRTGRMRDDLFPGLFSFPMGNYVIFYRSTEDGIEIIRVLSSYRDVNRLFRGNR